MKKLTFAVLALMVAFSAPAFADDHQTEPMEKLGRGITNVLTSPVELYNSISTATDEKNIFHGMTVGLVEGVLLTGARIGVGAFDIVTFPFPIQELTMTPESPMDHLK